MHRYARHILNDFRSREIGKRSGVSFALLAWWSFLLALISGAVLSFHYRPWGDVFKVVSRLTGFIPYGSFLRTLHYLSGQCFLVFALAHALESLWKSGYRTSTVREWINLTFLLVPAFCLLLTGFILKGDKEGIIAAGVTYHLSQEIPLIGSSVARLFLRPGEELFLLPYLHHTVILPFTVLFLLLQHRRRLFPRGDLGWPLMAALSLLAIIYPMPSDIPPHVDLRAPTGPWFFQGVQLLLRWAPPFWAGIVWPILPLCLMGSLPFVPSTLAPWVRMATALTWAAHGGLILLAWWLLPRLGV